MLHVEKPIKEHTIKSYYLKGVLLKITYSFENKWSITKCHTKLFKIGAQGNKYKIILTYIS